MARRDRRTHAEFVDIARRLYSDDFEILSEYQGKRSKVLVRHVKCGQEYETVAENLSRSGRNCCPHCKTVWNKRSHQEYQDKFRKRHGSSYALMSKYRSANEHVLVRHIECGHTWSVSAKNILDISGCPQCGHRKAMDKQALNPEEYTKRIQAKYNGEYVLHSKYRRMQSLVKIKHTTCGLVFEKTAADLLAGCLCPGCKEEAAMTTEKYKATVKELGNDEYIVLGEYVNSKEKILTKHKVCGYVWGASPEGFLFGRRCPKCAGNMRMTTEEFIQRVNRLTNGKYEVLSEYIKSIEKIRIRHTECGSIFETTPNEFTNGRRCPECSRSLGEIRISEILTARGIEFENQYRLEDCRNIKPLPFDFAIFEQGELHFLIEYHGRQHYEPVEYFGGEKEFAQLQKRDSIKKEYCRTNDIPLVVIPYWEKDLERAVENSLSELASI